MWGRVNIPYQYYKTPDSEDKGREDYATKAMIVMAFLFGSMGLLGLCADVQRNPANYSIEKRVEEKVNDNVGSFIGRSPPRSNP